MNRKRISVLLIVFFLVLGLIFPQKSSAETLAFNPPIKVSMNGSLATFKTDVFYGAAMSDADTTFQVLPDVNTILSDCKIKPHNAFNEIRISSSL